MDVRTILPNGYQLEHSILPPKRYILQNIAAINIYDHRLKNTRHPVRSAISKFQIARLVLLWVTTSESLVLWIGFFLVIFLTQTPPLGQLDCAILWSMLFSSRVI